MNKEQVTNLQEQGLTQVEIAKKLGCSQSKVSTIIRNAKQWNNLPSLRWSYDERVTPEEFIRRITHMVCGPVKTMQECDGDMWVSDYNTLVTANNRLHNAVAEMDKQLKGETDE